MISLPLKVTKKVNGSSSCNDSLVLFEVARQLAINSLNKHTKQGLSCQIRKSNLRLLATSDMIDGCITFYELTDKELLYETRFYS